MHPTAESPLVSDYLHYTRKVLPEMATQTWRDWPIAEDHCFQRVVLDTVCGGVWYEHLARPAYRHLTQAQAARAVDLCKAIADGRADLHKLNHQSLVWRGKRKARSAQVT